MSTLSEKCQPVADLVENDVTDKVVCLVANGALFTTEDVKDALQQALGSRELEFIDVSTNSVKSGEVSITIISSKDFVPRMHGKGAQIINLGR